MDAKGKKIPNDVDTKSIDPDGVFVVSPSGGMTKDIWNNVRFFLSFRKVQ